MPHSSDPTHDQSFETGRIFLYFGLLALLVDLGTPSGSLIDIPTSYLLKNQLHASATQVSAFRFVAGIPMYFAVFFGMVRDRWSPLGLRDRGFFIVCPLLTAGAMLWMGITPLSYLSLFVGMFVATVSYKFVMAAQEGLTSMVGQEKFMSGRLSALWNVLGGLQATAAAFSSGYVTEHLSRSQTFVLIAILALAIVPFTVWKPSAVFGKSYRKPRAENSLGEDIKRLITHRPIYPVIVIFFLWEFMPGTGTPLQYYLSNQLHASDAVYSYFNGIYLASYVPASILYGILCKRASLSKLLWWAAIIAVPQIIPLYFMHSTGQALVLAVPMGLLGGIATSAYFDLAIRSCPSGLQGSLMMLLIGLATLADRSGDLLGSKIYAGDPKSGFLSCVIATTIVYALILPVVALVPRRLIATADGERNTEIQP